MYSSSLTSLVYVLQTGLKTWNIFHLFEYQSVGVLSAAETRGSVENGHVQLLFLVQEALTCVLNRLLGKQMLQNSRILPL